MKKRRGLTIGILLALMAGSNMALAAEFDGMHSDTIDTYDMEDTVVTATRQEEKISNVPANVTVITAKDLEKRQVYSLREALKQEAGIYVTPTAETTGGLSMRGFGGKDILVMLDGQPLNTPFDGNVDWNSIPASEVQRIEIVRGAASSLYGGHAVAGVINIITKKPLKGDPHGSVKLSVGSNNTWQRNVSITGGEGKLSFRASYDKSTTDGWRGYYSKATPKSGKPSTVSQDLPVLSDGRTYIIGGRGEKSFDNEMSKIALRYDFDESKSLGYSYSHLSYKYQYNNPFSYLRDSNGNEIFSGKFTTQNGDILNVTPGNYLGYVGGKKQDIHRISYADEANKFKASAGYSNIYRQGYNSCSSKATDIHWAGEGTNADYPTKNYNIDVQKTWDFGRHSLLAGTAWSKDEMAYSNNVTANWRNWDSPSITKLDYSSGGSIYSTALFLQDEYKLADKWKMYVGLRYDRFDKKDGYTYASKKNIYRNHEDESFNSWSPKLAFSYAPNDSTLLFANYGKSFNAPSLYQLYRINQDASLNANPDLTPETSYTYELGVKQQIDEKNTYGMTYFHVDTRDQIALSSTGKYGKAYYNMNKGMTKGLELSYAHKFDKNWNTYLNYTFESGETTNSSGITSRNYNLPKHMIAMGVDYTKNRFNAVLDARYVGARQKEDAMTGEYGSEDPFFLTNLYLNYNIRKDWKVQLGIENLFNRHFYASEAVNERTYTLGVEFNF